MNEKTTDSWLASTVDGPATIEETVPTKQRKKTTMNGGNKTANHGLTKTSQQEYQNGA
jgi:hypothetical protein